MKKLSLLLLSAAATLSSFAQDIDKIINAKEVERIERILSADDMEGRATFTRGNDKAAAFIADEFKKAGLHTWKNSTTHLQSFTMVSGTPSSITVKADGADIDPKKVVVVSGKLEMRVTETSGLEKVVIAKGANLNVELRKYTTTGKSYLILLDTSFANIFGRLGGRPSMKSDRTIVYLLTSQEPQTFSVEAKFPEVHLQNVVGVLPGKSKPNEYVIFSGHYDHNGIQGKDRQGNPLPDSIFNGANDNAAGTTAVIMLAQYFKKLNDNERTLVFAAFTAEEVGGYGAQHFSKQFNAEDVKAMFNIEMIGTESKWGRNSAYITGYDKTNMGELLQANLQGTGFTFYPDPYPAQQLFYRSDNATLARLGVPAHTISTAKMDAEPHYHKASDTIETLDMENMAMIIKSIALSSRGIVSGKETPSRVDVSTLR
jgi:acetylornithine deacetylase/succinyl-diaminopimelate desuccinylase-like protein